MKRCALALAAAVLLLGTALARAQLSSSYELTWFTVDGGGSTTASQGGAYTVAGTAGQTDAGQLSGGAYWLGGGFWSGGPPIAHQQVYLPIVWR